MNLNKIDIIIDSVYVKNKMCSTPAITLFFVICDIVSGYYVYIKKTKYRNIFLVFIGFYGIMELLQFIQWIYGDINNCTYRNKFFTKPPLGLEPIFHGLE